MSGFKVGDRVRIKSAPDRGEGRVRWANEELVEYRRDDGGLNWRHPEELELVPEPIKAGDTVSWRGHKYQVLAWFTRPDRPGAQLVIFRADYGTTQVAASQVERVS